eukprot:TRINITY_DN1557_c0_g1_i3.p1 TRINITY_DN1557_c0_g1~~TRINITY_DN1557_c0_g1_i3.p1  ORF type:complete len:347 (-),score=23.07 TRINITY_DN1557_c0_g1_i3:33-1073(-)
MLNLTTNFFQYSSSTSLSTYEKRVIWIIFLTSNSLSLLGSLFILASMLCFNSMLRKLPSRLILYLTICSLLNSIGNLISFSQLQRKNLIPCLVQAVIIQVFGVGTFLWIVVIAFNLYMVVVHHVLSMNKFEKYYHIFCWGICFSLSFLPIITSSYGPVEGQLWCWISVEKNVLWGHMWRFVCFFLPLYICLGIIVVLYARVYYAIKSIVPEEPEESGVSESILRKLKAYPIVFLLVWLFPTINRIFNWVAQDVAFVLLLLSVLTSPLEGFLNAFVYGLHTDLRNKFKQVLIRNGCCLWLSLSDDSNYEEELVYTEDDNDPSVLNAFSVSYGTAPESENKRKNNDYD